MTRSGGAVAVTSWVSFWRSSLYAFRVSARISKNVDVPTIAAILRPLRFSTVRTPAPGRATMAPSTAVATPELQVGEAHLARRAPGARERRRAQHAAGGDGRLQELAARQRRSQWRDPN